MENLDIKKRHADAKKNAERIYKSTTVVRCPDLNENIAFTKVGFRHLVRKGGKRRSLREQTRRFLLLPYAKEIIESSKVKIIHGKGTAAHPEHNHGDRMLARPAADFWTLTKTYGETAITVVVQADKTKRKTLLQYLRYKTETSKNRHVTVI